MRGTFNDAFVDPDRGGGLVFEIEVGILAASGERFAEVRLQVTLGQADKASQALRDAITANPGQADTLRQQASMLGVK